MNILLVDDEMLEIEGIKSTVDFSALGFDQIFEANNIRQAKELLTKHSIQVMLCDIEMPQGNGLELLEWVRIQFPRLECVFLTCHADFHYAHKAIQLRSLDYLLKPVMGPDLEEVLKKAVSKVRENDEAIEYRQFSRLWLKHQPLLVERFWLDLVNQMIPSRQEEIKAVAASINIPGLEELKTFPVLIRIQRWNEKMSMRDEKLMEYGLRNVANEMIVKDDGNGIVMELNQGLVLVLLYLDGFERVSARELYEKLSKFVTAAHELLNCDICCYAGMESFSFELADMVKKLLDLDRNNVSLKNRLLFLNSRPETQADITMPNAGIWLSMLERLEGERVISEVTAYLDQLSNENRLNAYTIHQFQHYFMNLFFIFSKSKDIALNSLWTKEEDLRTFQQATHSVDDMKTWIFANIRKMCAYVMQQEKSRSVVGKIKQYIANNLDKDLSCEDLAAQVYLNPIYLNRLFKKDTGFALTEYLQLQRIQLAKELLAETDLPVSNIAQRIGYSNFSHFSRTFRKHTEQSPVDYRKLHTGHRDKTGLV